MEEKEEAILKEGIRCFGPSLQLSVAIEELAELIQEASKIVRIYGMHPNLDDISSIVYAKRMVGLIEELADAEIALQTITLVADELFDGVVEDEVRYQKKKKMERLRRIIETSYH